MTKQAQLQSKIGTTVIGAIAWSQRNAFERFGGSMLPPAKIIRGESVRISMMMAMDKANLIGKAGGLPWKISSDMQHFKRVTMGKPLIMGRVTFDSLGKKPLPGRPHIVLTRDTEWRYSGVDSAQTLEQAFELARTYDSEEMMVIGGASLCEIAMPYTERLYLTVIDHEFVDGDTWLDSFSWDDWNELTVQSHDETEMGGYRFTYYTLERRQKTGL